MPMNEEILINTTPMEIRVAVLENGVLNDLHIERTLKKGLVGNIYKGKILRVLPGMQAAFVDIGIKKAAFMHFDEPKNPENQGVSNAAWQSFREGQSLVVQVVKDPIASKGARLSTQLSIPSRYLVYLPNQQHLGVSLRIENEAERERLKKLVSDILKLEGIDESAGFILRTAAEGVNEAELVLDIRYLRRLWQQIESHLSECVNISLIYEDLSLPFRVVRDMITTQTARVRIDSQAWWEKLNKFTGDLIPEFADRLELYTGDRPIFDLYHVEEEIQNSLQRKVVLKSGGYLVIDPTEAMTTIDVNTGAFVGKHNLEETIFKTNLEASVAIAKQLRIRNLTGMVIIDFINMQCESHQDQVLKTLERELKKDNEKTNVLGFSTLGLVELTRKRTRESLEQQLCESCPTCQGRGTIKSLESICYDLIREIIRAAKTFEINGLMVVANPMVIKKMLEEDDGNQVADLSTCLGKFIEFKADDTYLLEQYDVALI